VQPLGELVALALDGGTQDGTLMMGRS
jgi:hypothetical protein